MAVHDKENDPKTTANKLHRQFGHPTPEALIQLIKNARLNNARINVKQLIKEIRGLSETCIICLRNKRTHPRPVVCLPLAKRFNELVGMDLKKWGDSYFLVMVDIATRYCTAHVIRNKLPSTIITAIFVTWITIFGAPRKFLTDNGGEFVNFEMRDLSECFCIQLLTTAAESPWSNGICERLNGTLADIVNKIIDETNCGVQMALAWTVAARNALTNKAGMSPNQLVFGFNPAFPNIYDSNLPASSLENASTEIVSKNWMAMNKAREIFVRYEANERIRKALRHNIRYSALDTLKVGDEVLYKRKDDAKWHGPGKVTNIDLRAKTATINHGGHPIKAHSVSILKIPELNLEKSEESDAEDIDAILDEQQLEENESNIQLEKEIENHTSNSNLNNDLNQTLKPQSEQRISKAEENLKGKKKVQDKRNNSEQNAKNNQVRKKTDGNVIDMRNLKCGQRFQGFDSQSGEHISGRIINRAGKVKGSNKYCYNVQRDDLTGRTHWVNMENIQDLTFVPDDTQMIVLFTSSDIRNAKDKEIAKWIFHNVFEEVEDEGQPTISVRWVITERVLNDKIETKARLVARGFEEDTSHLLKDAPTCSTEAVRLTVSIASSKRWDCHMVDVKSAYLQGDDISRDVFLRPPEEFDNGLIWKLRKTIYGLADAARAWYKRVKEELLSLGVTISELDTSLFFWHVDGVLEGLLCVYVDDFLYCGTKLFADTIIAKLMKKFEIGSSAEITFTYVGIRFNSYQDGLTMDQEHYIASISKIDLPKLRKTQKDSDLTTKERKSFRTLVGQLSWLSTHTRPDICFETCELGGLYKQAKITHILKLNTLVDRLKSSSVHLYFPRLPILQNCIIKCYTDASFRSLPNEGSQAGFLILIEGDSGLKRCPIYWQSKKIDKVVDSSQAAEAYALNEGAKTAIFIAKLLKELIKVKEIPVICLTDNENLVKAIYSEKVTKNRWLRISLLEVSGLIKSNLVTKVQWVSSKNQLADPLTKKGVSRDELLNSISRG